MKTDNEKILLALLISIIFSIFQIAQADRVCEPCPCDPGLECVHGVCYEPGVVVACPPIEAPGFEGLIKIAINLIFYVAVISGFPMLIIAGFFYLTAAGNPEQLEKAKRIMIYAFIGLFLALFSYAIGSLLEYFITRNPF